MDCSRIRALNHGLFRPHILRVFETVVGVLDFQSILVNEAYISNNFAVISEDGSSPERVSANKSHYPSRAELEGKIWYRVFNVLAVVFLIIAALFAVLLGYEFWPPKNTYLKALFFPFLLIQFALLAVYVARYTLLYVLYGKKPNRT